MLYVRACVCFRVMICVMLYGLFFLLCLCDCALLHDVERCGNCVCDLCVIYCVSLCGLRCVNCLCVWLMCAV